MRISFTARGQASASIQIVIRFLQVLTLEVEFALPIAKGSPGRRHLGAFQVVVETHLPVDDTAGGELDDPVGHGADELMVVGSEQEHLAEGDQTVVEGGDRLQVQVVGRLVQDQHVGAGQHHPGQHAADPLATGENIRRLEHVLTAEQHLAQETAGEVLALLGRGIQRTFSPPERTFTGVAPSGHRRASIAISRRESRSQASR